MPFQISSLIDYLKSLNKKDIINFSYCLSLALVFWLLNALSNQYNSTLNFSVKYIKAPEGKGINVIVNENDLPRLLQININALGRDIVWYSIASYLSHIDINNLKGLEIEMVYNWKIGETLVMDRTHIHCASSNIVGKKLGLTTFTKK